VTPPTSTFSFDALRREPDVEADNLVAVDAADRLLLDEAASVLRDAPAGTVVVIGDHYGALTLGAAALHGATDIRTHQDSLVGERALDLNAERTGLTGTYRHHGLGAELTTGARVVLLQLPRSLDELDEIAGVVAAHAHPDVIVLAGGRVKHMTRAMNDVLGRSFTTVRAHLARQKARVLRATGPRPDAVPADRWPARAHDADLDVTVLAHGAVFAGPRVDIGTRTLLAHLDAMAPDARTVVDLGCGSGVVATVLARSRPAADVVTTDVSAAAAASARATADANGVGERVTVRRDDALSSMADASADLVVLNPPFHVGSTVHSGVAHRLFADAGRVLRPGGELWAVWNSHLMYRPVLERAVGRTRQVSRNPKFTVTVSTRKA
jgi:16S rRNA (guanine1207-N2)-methyltransferase